MFHYKNILVISDNLVLSDRFRKWILSKSAYNDLNFSFRKTVASTFEQAADNDILDLKNNSHVETILTNFDIVFSLNCAALFPASLVNSIKCINIHPGYNPDTRGCYSEVFSIIYGTKIGATIHEMDAELDHGPIIVREEVLKEDWDTAHSLYHKIIEKEFELIENNFDAILNNSYTVSHPGDGRIFTKKDFRKLQQIDLAEKKTFRELIDHLRALTFEGYDNCYFINKDGVKVFVSVQLKPGIKE